MGVLLASGALTGCRMLECGQGTIEMDGVCIAGSSPTTPECGNGFFWSETSQQCRNGAIEDGGFAMCDQPNTDVVVDDAGVPHCISLGGGGTNCDEPIACPDPDPGKMTICGRIIKVRDTQPLDAESAPGGPSEGVEVRLYEPLGFVANPGGPPLVPPIFPDTCGRYRFEDITPPSTGFIAVAVDDRAGSGSNQYMLTGAAFIAESGTFAGTTAWVADLATVEAWGMLAEPDVDFVTLGVYLPIFLDPLTPPLGELPGAPVPDVIITEGLTTTQPAKDFYFSDTDPLMRTTLDMSLDRTGPNGSGLMIMTGLQNHSGLGGEPQDCTWPANMSAAIGGVVFVQERVAECF